MLEILLLIHFCKRIGAKVRDKGYKSATGYQIMLVLMWLGGEIFGAFFGGIVAEILANGREEPNMLLAYGCALLGAAAGAAITFLIVGNLSPADDHSYYREEQGYFDRNPAADPNAGGDQYRRGSDDQYRR
jgi:hypothetical protein